MHSIRWLGYLVITGTVIVGSVGVVGAHETKTVNGYELTFGGSDEPVITGERMWLQIEIVDAETDEPAEGLADSVEIAVQRPFGNDTFNLDVDGVHGRPGWYEGAVVFTEPGTYTVFITAEIDGTQVETSFQKQVHNASALQYPHPASTPAPDTGMDASIGFGLGVVVATVGMIAVFVIGRRR